MLHRVTGDDDLPGKCGVCRWKLGQRIRCEDCDPWFHWEHADTNSELVILTALVLQFLCACQGNKKRRPILNWNRELDLARTEIGLLKGELIYLGNCSEQFQIESSSQRKLKILLFSLAMLETQTGSDFIDQSELEVFVLGSSCSRGKVELDELNHWLPGLDRLVQHKKRLRKLARSEGSRM
jgi:hypothetical protein